MSMDTLHTITTLL